MKVLKRSPHRTLAEVRLETGRKHQIRVHLAEQGHPIVGDHAYGSPTNPIRRLALHAAKLAFKHPRTGKLLEFVSPPPALFCFLDPDITRGLLSEVACLSFQASLQFLAILCCSLFAGAALYINIVEHPAPPNVLRRGRLLAAQWAPRLSASHLAASAFGRHRNPYVL